MRLVWYQRQDGLWNAACACNATVVGIAYERRADAETAHFETARIKREHRANNPERIDGVLRASRNQIPPCGPKLPEPNPNFPDPFVFP
jgi:hypothetical protein